MAKIIIFGGSGFIGSHVADVLVDRGHTVRIFDVKRSAFLRAGQEVIIGNILDVPGVTAAVKGCDYVYNFAGIADLDALTTKPLDTVRQNIEGNVNILEAAKQAGVRRYIYASTIYVYSAKGGFYRCSKQAAELYVEEFQRKFGLSFTILRYGTLYGPRADHRNSIYRYVSQAIHEGCITCQGTGEEMREYVNVKDAARLSVAILDEQYKNRNIIISGHHPVKFRQLLETIREICNDDIKIQFSNTDNPDHYDLTPYSYIPRIGEKLTTNCYIDLGQGLLECFQEIYRHNE